MLQVTMVGASFRPASAKEIIKQLSIGDRLELRADPNNEYDSTAVACYYDDIQHGYMVHIGFIPRDSNSALFAVLMDGAEISAEIVAFQSDLKPVLEISFDRMAADQDYSDLELTAAAGADMDALAERHDAAIEAEDETLHGHCGQDSAPNDKR